MRSDIAKEREIEIADVYPQIFSSKMKTRDWINRKNRMLDCWACTILTCRRKHIARKSLKTRFLICLIIRVAMKSRGFAHDTRAHRSRIRSRRLAVITKLLNLDFHFSIQADFTRGRHKPKLLCNARCYEHAADALFTARFHPAVV